MAQITGAEPALNNLDDIATYIAFSNPYAAKQLVENVFGMVQFTTSARPVASMSGNRYLL